MRSGRGEQFGSWLVGFIPADQGSGLDARKLFDPFELLLDRARSHRRFLDVIARLAELLLHGVEHGAKATKLGFYSAKQCLDFTGSLLHSEGAKPHLEAVEKRGQCSWPSNGDSVVALECFDQPRPSQDLSIKPFTREEEYPEIGGQWWLEILLADLFGRRLDPGLEFFGRALHRAAIAVLRGFYQSLIVLFRKLSVDRKPYGIIGTAASGQPNRKVDPFTASRLDRNLF